MARPVDKPFVCPICDHICQYETRTSRKNGKLFNYKVVVHVDEIPRLGLDREICSDCKDWR